MSSQNTVRTGDELDADLRAALTEEPTDTTQGDTVTAADRPSVTDNARAEAWRRFPDGIDPETGEPVDDYGYPATAREAFIGGAEWAAGRTETTTATIEDTARAIHRALAPRWMSVAQALGPDQDAYEAMLADIAKSLADTGLLATARTRPTREELAEAIMDSDTIPCDVCDDSRCHYCRSEALRKADAVLVLYADQPTEAEAGARALEQAAEWLRSDMDEPWGDRAANRLYVRAARIRAGGAR